MADKTKDEIAKDLAIWMWGKHPQDAALLIKQAFMYLGHGEDGALISCKLLAAALYELK